MQGAERLRSGRRGARCGLTGRPQIACNLAHRRSRAIAQLFQRFPARELLQQQGLDFLETPPVLADLPGTLPVIVHVAHAFVDLRLFLFERLDLRGDCRELALLLVAQPGAGLLAWRGLLRGRSRLAL